MTSRRSTGSNFERMRTGAIGLIFLAGILAVVADASLESWHVPGTRWFLPSPIGTVAGATLLLASLGLRRARPQFAIFTCVFVYSALAAVVIDFRKPTTGDVTHRPSALFRREGERTEPVTTPIVHVSDYEWYHQHTQQDPRWGHGGIPNVVAEHHHREFQVRYTLDGDGWRQMPVPKTTPSRGEVLFLGCSFTFGFGVEDPETYPALLAAGPWNRFVVRNISHIAWGTSHAYLYLQHRMRSAPKPLAVVYAWISRHAARNHKRKSWHGATGLDFPLFDLENRELRYQGIIPRAQADWEDGPDLDAKEAEISLKLIHGMNRLCNAHQVPFLVLALNDGESKPDLVLPKLREDPDIQLIDLAELTDDLHPINLHPTRYYHRAIARAIASDARLGQMTGISELGQPDAIPKPPRQWRLASIPSTGAWARIERPDDPKCPVRVTEIHQGTAKPWELILRCRHIPLRAKQEYVLKMRIRAAAPRNVKINVSQDHAPWSILGFDENLALTENWRDLDFTFTCPSDEPDACLMLQLADSSVPFEIESISLWDDKIDLIATETTRKANDTFSP